MAERDSTMAPDASVKGDALHKRAIERYKTLLDYWSENRRLALEDIKFRAGEQWPEQIKRAREAKFRPVLTFNKQEATIRQVVNDGRQNRPSVKYRPVDSGSDKRVADAYQGIVRHILASSNADEAFDTALDHAAGNGFGYFRVLTEWAHDDAFEQDIRVARIRNPLAVLLAPHQAADGADCEDGFVVDEMSREEFAATWPKAKFLDWNLDERQYAADWLTKTTVRVAEYFYRVHEEMKLVQLEDGQVLGEDEYAELAGRGMANLPAVKNRRTAKRATVRWCRLSGAEVLEEREWPSRYIPIIPVYGTEMDVDGKVIYSGMVRPAMDALRLYNYERTAYCERVALAPKAPWVAAEGQTEGHPEWDTANTENHAVLTYTPQDVNGTVLPPPQRVQASDVPTGLLQGMQVTEHDIQAAFGIFAAGLGDRSNEKSGKAILARQREGDVSTFHYHDNLNRAVRHLGRILLDLIPRIYDTRRVVRLLGEDGTDELAIVNPRSPLPVGVMGGLPMFNLSHGRYDVDVSAGPSYTTKRQESAEAMLAMTERNPQMWQSHGDLIVQSQDWPLAEEFAKRTKALMPPEVKDAIAKAEEEGDDEDDSRLRQVMEQADRAIEERERALQQAAEKIRELEKASADKAAEAAAKLEEARVKRYEAETERLKIVFPILDPATQEAIRAATAQQVMTPADLDAEAPPMNPDALAPPDMGGMPAPMQ